MIRQRKTRSSTGLLDVVALLPWWAAVAMAAMGYLVLHRLATPVPVVAVQPGQLSHLVVQTVITALAVAGQYVVPVIFLAGAALSFMRRRQRATLLSDVAHAKSVQALDAISWREFELLVGEAFRLQGYRVTENGGGGPDGGIDLILTKNNEEFLVQCKQWKAFRVGVSVVRELYGVMAARGSTGGFVVTSGRFTDDARAFAEGRNVHLVDGLALFAAIRQTRPLRPGRSVSTPQPAQRLVTASKMTAVGAACPQCGSAMVQRTARKGDRAGSQFLGCSTFPACRGSRPLK